MGSFKKEASRRVRDGTDKGGGNFKIKGYVFPRLQVVYFFIGKLTSHRF